MAVPNLQNLQSLGEIKQNFRWYIDFKQVVKNLSLGTLGITPDKLYVMCESTDLPRKDIEWITITLHGTDIKQAGKANMAGELTFTFVDNVDSLVEKMIHTWGQNIYLSTQVAQAADNQWSTGASPTPGATNNSPGQYKCDIEISRLNTARTKVIQTYLLSGCGYVSYDPGGTLSGADSEAARPALTISYDGWYVKKASAT